MPAIPQLQPRFLSDNSPNSISATAIGLIVGIGLVPTIILIWLVIWLLFLYPSDRNCCGMRRKKSIDVPEMLEQRGNGENTFDEKERTNYNVPQRLVAAHSRTGSGSRLTKPDASSVTIEEAEARLSVQSRVSGSTIQGAHEPKPFV